jgi:hypothetical protein
MESMTMGVCIAKPKYPKYAIRATRLDSFKMWPRNMKQSPEELALAGFFFTGKLIWFQKLWKSIYIQTPIVIDSLETMLSFLVRCLDGKSFGIFPIAFLDDKSFGMFPIAFLVYKALLEFLKLTYP